MSTVITEMLRQWHESMDERGHMKGDPACYGCGRELNADGNHPAETYGGTFTGLCYGCTKKGRVLTGIAVLDGCWKTDHPPACPSYRRNRETHYGYPDCPKCKGWGRLYENSCQDCSDRYFRHPQRQAGMEYSMKLRHSIHRASRTALLRALGVPKRASKKAQDAALEGLTEEIKDQVRREMAPRVFSMLMRRNDRTARLQLDEWRSPAEYTGVFGKAA